MASLAVSRSCTRNRNTSQGSTGSVFWLLWLSRGKGVRPSTLLDPASPWLCWLS
jgi:hypothetical protein